MYRSSSFKVTKEVEVEIDIDDVMENINHDRLFEALMEAGDVDASTVISDMDATDVLDELDTSDVIHYATRNLDTDELLDGLKEQDRVGLVSWLESNPDIIPTKDKVEEPKVEEPKPEPTPLWLSRPVVVLEQGEVRYDSDPLVSYGTYTFFNNMLCVNAFGVQFLAATLKDASNILNALALDVTVTNQEV
jgi:hypothetical protein